MPGECYERSPRPAFQMERTIHEPDGKTFGVSVDGFIRGASSSRFMDSSLNIWKSVARGPVGFLTSLD
jgi:hypothetical protein